MNTKTLSPLRKEYSPVSLSRYSRHQLTKLLNDIEAQEIFDLVIEQEEKRDGWPERRPRANAR